MRLPSYAVLITLALLYVVAVFARLHGSGVERSPYFGGASAMNYRHVVAVADGASLSELDLKAGWPDGYRPARYRAAGLEYFMGKALAVARYFSEVDARDFVSRFAALMFSLCVFTVYAFARRLWDCQAAGLLAAGFVAAFAPLVAATNGRELDHNTLAVFLITVHATLLLRSHRRRSLVDGVLAALVAFAVVASWELGLYYVAFAVALASLAPASRAPRHGWVTAAHAVVVLAACTVLPFSRGARAVLAWPTILVVGVAAVDAFPARIRGRGRRALVCVAGALVVSMVLAAVSSGGGGGVPVLQTVWYHVRYAFGKPAPGLLSDAARYLWSIQHAPPSAHALLMFFLPVALLAAAVAAAADDLWKRFRAALVVAAAVGVAAALAFVVDRAAAAVAAVALAPVLSASGRSISTTWRSRGAPVVIGGYLILAQLVFPLSAANPTFQIAKSAGFAYRDPNKFLWISMEDTDRALVRFVATRTSVSDAVLGSDGITALLLAFAGRTSVPLPGAVTRGDATRNAVLARAVYDGEASLYETCRRERVGYVLYSIDMLLDTSHYGPRYLAGVAAGGVETSAAFRMHFEPESLRNFTLVYENAHYRLFKVTEKAETVFLTDHPPVYQPDVFARAGRNFDAFRKRVIDLTLTYREARVSAAGGNFDGALKKLNWCLEQAPGFTDARIAVGTTLTQAGRLEEARDVLLSVIGYAPDNEQALYHTAYVLAALEETDRAREYLDLFFATATTRELIDKAHLLRTFIEQGIRVTPRSTPQ